MSLVTNIQRFAIHDGPGVRTTVFFKGCPLECEWCHNAECISFERQEMFFAERCTGCGECTRGGECPRNARESVGRDYSVRELVRICARDRAFYEASGGGVTLSGGEVMAQSGEYLIELLRGLSREGIDVAIDTSGFAPWNAFEAALPYVSLFLYDIKLMDDIRHRRFTGKPNALILENLVKLSRAGKALEISLPLIEGVNASEGDISAVSVFLRKENIRPAKIRLLPYHDIGTGKRERLGMPRSAVFVPPDERRMAEIRQFFIDEGFINVQVGG